MRARCEAFKGLYECSWLLVALNCSSSCHRLFGLLLLSPAMEIIEDSLLQHRSFNPKDVVAREPSSWRDLVPADFLMESAGAGGGGGGAWVLLRRLQWYLYQVCWSLSPILTKK